MNKLLAALRAQYVTPYLRVGRSHQSNDEPLYRRRKWRKYYSVPKLVAGELPGSLHQEFRRCGKAGCKCSSGRAEDRHGPYWVRRWREEGKMRKQVVPADQLAAVREAIRQRVERQRMGRDRRDAYMFRNAPKRLGTPLPKGLRTG